jgi:hypothetical protein
MAAGTWLLAMFMAQKTKRPTPDYESPMSYLMQLWIGLVEGENRNI